MNQKIKGILIAAVLTVLLFVVTGCGADQSQYEINDSENYTVSVKFDANGGEFTTNTTVIVDAYDISGLNVDGNGNMNIALLSPDNALRGQNDAHTATKAGHFLAGWYAERTGEEGNYAYSRKWDFANDRLSVSANEAHTSAEPVMTLYAVWVPAFEIEFYELETGDLLETYTFNPTQGQEFQLPDWNEETGAIEMYQFPKREGYTFTEAYYDEAGTQIVNTEMLTHPGSVDEATGVAQNPTLKLYTTWQEGEWYQIYNAQQFLDNASVAGNYAIHADLDFEGEIWPTSLMHGNFTGTIQGNGHTFKNISVEQTNNSKVNTGLFGAIMEGAELTDVKFENVTLTIKKGTRVAGATFGVLAGTISEKAAITGVTIQNSSLMIDAGAYFGTEDYVMGLVAGMGNPGIDFSDITATVAGEEAALWAVIHDDGSVTLSDDPGDAPAIPEETVPEETVPEETTAA